MRARTRAHVSRARTHSGRRCHRCGEPKAEDSPAVPLTGGGGVGSNGSIYPDGDWECLSCGNNNFRRRTECNRCGLPKGKRKPEEPIDEAGDGKRIHI